MTPQRHIELLVLIHSPLVPSVTVDPLAVALRGLEYDAVIPSLSSYGALMPNWHGYQSSQIEQELVKHSDRAKVAVAHSGAGTLLSTLCPTGTSAYVMLDAIFADRPGCRLNFFDDQASANAWRGIAARHDDRIPAEMIAQLGVQVQDSDLRSAFEAAVVDVPAALYTGAIPIRGDWPARIPGLYLQWTSAYAEDAERAARAGFHVVRHPASRFELMNNPEAIAGRLAEFLDGGP